MESRVRCEEKAGRETEEEASKGGGRADSYSSDAPCLAASPLLVVDLVSHNPRDHLALLIQMVINLRQS